MMLIQVRPSVHTFFTSQMPFLTSMQQHINGSYFRAIIPSKSYKNLGNTVKGGPKFRYHVTKLLPLTSQTSQTKLTLTVTLTDTVTTKIFMNTLAT